MHGQYNDRAGVRVCLKDSVACVAFDGRDTNGEFYRANSRARRRRGVGYAMRTPEPQKVDGHNWNGWGRPWKKYKRQRLRAA
jgi:hypothetical protein